MRLENKAPTYRNVSARVVRMMFQGKELERGLYVCDEMEVM